MSTMPAPKNPKNSGTITQNGLHPISQRSATVEKKGESGSERDSTPKASQVTQARANGGASFTRPAAPGPSTPALAANQGAETKHRGSTAEEQQGKFRAGSAKLYPKMLGLRGQDI